MYYLAYLAIQHSLLPGELLSCPLQLPSRLLQLFSAAGLLTLEVRPTSAHWRSEPYLACNSQVAGVAQNFFCVQLVTSNTSPPLVTQISSKIPTLLLWRGFYRSFWLCPGLQTATPPCN